MDGYELSRQLLDGELAHRFMIISGDVGSAHDDERSSTAAAIVRKPFDTASLIDAVRVCLCTTDLSGR